MLTRALLILYFASTSFWGSSQISEGENDVNHGMHRFVSIFPFEDGKSLKIQASVEHLNFYITGVVVAKMIGDTVKGVFMNEFGVKVFEFEVLRGRCRLMHVLEIFDKWYFRKTIRNDFAFIFTLIDKPLEEVGVYEYPFCGNKNVYRYLFEQGKITTLLRIEKGKTTAVVECGSDSVLTLRNTDRNIAYKFKIVAK